MSEEKETTTVRDPVEPVVSKNHHEVAEKIFDNMIDDEMLTNMFERNLIACKLGYKLSCIAEIELELEDSY
jgi:hypothetical protein